MKLQEDPVKLAELDDSSDEEVKKKKKSKKSKKDKVEKKPKKSKKSNGSTKNGDDKPLVSKAETSSSESDDSSDENDTKSKKTKKSEKTKTKTPETVEKPVRRVRTRSMSSMMSEDMDEDGEKPVKKSAEELAGAFSNFDIREITIKKLQAAGISYLFPIQYRTFNFIKSGIDLIAQARTGTGKTLSFTLPIVEELERAADFNTQRGRLPKVLVMAPTRELAKQINDDFEKVSSRLSVYCIYGGTPYSPQERAIRDGLDVLVGTPGRIFDLMQKGTLHLDQVEHVILDEVDRMLDMGFVDKVEDIIKGSFEKEKKPQMLLFSATMPSWVKDISKKYMENSEHINLVGTQVNRTSVNVQHLAIKCLYRDRAGAVGRVVQQYSGEHGRAMVFCQTKKDADELAISPEIKQEAHVMHGDIKQEKRELVLKKFREGKIKVLITTDVAARGLDVPEVDLVVQCSPPKDVDSYIHRSGRTGRAGRPGVCVCFFKPYEEWDLKKVEQTARLTFKRVGVPTVTDIVNTSAKDAERSILSVSEAARAQFEEKAKALVEKVGGIAAVAAALAVISGATNIKSHSLINSEEGVTTFLFKTNIEMRGTGYVWRAIETALGTGIKDKIKTIRMCTDKTSVVFDLPYELEGYVADHWTDGKWDTLAKATELPEVIENTPPPRPPSGGGRQGYGGGNRRFGGGGGGRGRGGGGGGGGWNGKRSYGGGGGPAKRGRYN